MPRKFDRSPAAVQRRKGVVKRLENQLLTGFKHEKTETGELVAVKLTEQDIGRIKKEIETLQTRL